MDLSMAGSVPRLVAFYAVMLLLVYPLCQVVDRLLNSSKRRTAGSAKRA